MKSLFAILAAPILAAIPSQPHTPRTPPRTISWTSGGVVVQLTSDDYAALGRAVFDVRSVRPRDSGTPIFASPCGDPGTSSQVVTATAGGNFQGAQGINLYDDSEDVWVGLPFGLGR